ncbi:protein kinase [Actinokineospora soli]|uniref:non-specific serine/threonine protein kinase n=1 Tax=Actinokineospora soli TaxID=1048753 RepID=A0ABW2TL75_9PSEU
MGPRSDPGAPTAAELHLPGYSGFQLVAQGGEGAVYRARQDGLGRDVAIKALQAVDPATQARFRRELEITVRLGRQHPHIVTVLDTGTLPDGRPCIVMEFYDLGSLHDRLRAHGPLPVADVVAAGVAVADALAFAHAQGILHRDVKPQNVLVLPTSYVLADFGIARGADAGHSASLQMVSYRHAAPQMIDGAAPAAADDQWSLGSTLFTLLTGAPPFAGDNPDEDTVLPYLDRVRSAEPRPLNRADVPQALADVIARCLSKRREDRFPDAGALRDALASVAADLRRWQPTVDPDATAIAPDAPAPVEEPTRLPDFGPAPTPAPTPVPEPEPVPEPPPAPEARGTMTGRLADLTVRREDPLPVEFGPGAPAQSEEDTPLRGELPVWAPETPTVPKLTPAAHEWEYDTAPPAPPAPEGRRWKGFAIAGVVAAVVGVGIGLLASRDTTVAPTTSAPAPTTTTSPPIRPGGDPAVAPKLTKVDDRGESAELTWTDPTAGRAQFVLYDVTEAGAVPEPITSIAPGQTKFTVTGLDPDAPQYCFQLVAIGIDDPSTQRGASDRLCVSR